MPKIINDLERSILAEARRQVMENGYSATTIRSVAKGCGIAAGTLYNYFPSKEVMTATFILQDWQASMEAMRLAISGAITIREQLEIIFEGIRDFRHTYDPLFSDAAAAQTSAGGFPQRHVLLRSQVAELFRGYCGQVSPEDGGKLLAEFIAESMLAWSESEVSFDMLWPLFEKLFH